MDEEEYIAMCLACSKDLWLQKLLLGLFDLELDATCIYCDNQSCIKLSENSVFHDQSKHINIKYHYICDMVEKGVARHQYVATDGKVADMLTNLLSKVKFKYFRDKLGVFQKDVPRKSE